MLKVDGFDDCIVGVVHQRHGEAVLAYSVEAMVRNLVDQGLTAEDACDHIEFNIISAYYGDETPIFLRDDMPLELLF